MFRSYYRETNLDEQRRKRFIYPAQIEMGLCQLCISFFIPFFVYDTTFFHFFFHFLYCYSAARPGNNDIRSCNANLGEWNRQRSGSGGAFLYF